MSDRYKKIADGLDAIASGEFFDGKALNDALELPYTIVGDSYKRMLNRYIAGGEFSADRFKLQHLANIIRRGDIA